VDLDNPRVLIALPIGPKTVFFASPDAAQRKEFGTFAPSRIAALLNAQTVKRCETYVFGGPSCAAGDYVQRAFAERGAILPP